MLHPGFCYTLLLENKKFYVGHAQADNLARRIAQHFVIPANGAKWTQLHKPLCVLSVKEGPVALETATTASLMARHGFENVRGAGWCRAEMKEPDFLKAARDYEKFKEEKAEKEETASSGESKFSKGAS